VTAVSPTPTQCEAILRAAGIDVPLTRVEPVPLPDYSPNIICFLNDRYVLRMTTVDGETRFGRERAALERLAELPGVPRVPARPVERLAVWLREGVLAAAIG
jgi:hypothetical protein